MVDDYSDVEIILVIIKFKCKFVVEFIRMDFLIRFVLCIEMDFVDDESFLNEF